MADMYNSRAVRNGKTEKDERGSRWRLHKGEQKYLVDRIQKLCFFGITAQIC